MELRHLELMKTVDEEGSLTRAAEKLYLSQSALSHQLKELETQLDAPVFHRMNKKLVLTPVGKVVLKSAKRILKEVKKAEWEIKRQISGDTGSIRIATECYTCYHWLPRMLKGFNRDFPLVEIEIFPEATRKPVAELLKGKLDVAITSQVPNNPKLQFKELFTDELVAVVSNDHPWREKSYVTARDFKDQDLIIHSLPLESVTVFHKVLIPADIEPQKVIPIQLTEAAVEMVKAGLGVGVMARWAVKPYLNSGQVSIVPVTKKGLYRTWYAVMIMNLNMPNYIHHFIDQMAREMKNEE